MKDIVMFNKKSLFLGFIVALLTSGNNLDAISIKQIIGGSCILVGAPICAIGGVLSWAITQRIKEIQKEPNGMMVTVSQGENTQNYYLNNECMKKLNDRELNLRQNERAITLAVAVVGFIAFFGGAYLIKADSDATNKNHCY
jgi:hypothetical protein